MVLHHRAQQVARERGALRANVVCRRTRRAVEDPQWLHLHRLADRGHRAGQCVSRRGRRDRARSHRLALLAGWPRGMGVRRRVRIANSRSERHRDRPSAGQSRRPDDVPPDGAQPGDRRPAERRREVHGTAADDLRLRERFSQQLHAVGRRRHVQHRDAARRPAPSDRHRRQRQRRRLGHHRGRQLQHRGYQRARTARTRGQHERHQQHARRPEGRRRQWSDGCHLRSDHDLHDHGQQPEQRRRQWVHRDGHAACRPQQRHMDVCPVRWRGVPCRQRKRRDQPGCRSGGQQQRHLHGHGDRDGRVRHALDARQHRRRGGRHGPRPIQQRGGRQRRDHAQQRACRRHRHLHGGRGRRTHRQCGAWRTRQRHRC